MEIKTSSRSDVKVKIALTGLAGSGKTYSSLLLARGLCSSWDKVCLIDTENGSSNLYAHLGPFKVMTLDAPFSPEKYVQALLKCKEAGIDVVIIDSISHCWEFLLQAHASLAGNSFTNWGKITPRHDSFVQSILQTEMHVIATMRTKTGYVLNQINGKYVPEKLGLRTIQRDGIDYEFTALFELDPNHRASVTKDRTSLFPKDKSLVIDTSTGSMLLGWCNPEQDELAVRIHETKSISELMLLYSSNPKSQKTHADVYKQKQLDLRETGSNGRIGSNGKGVSHG